MQLTGENAVKEFHKFKIKGPGRGYSVIMGPEYEAYTVQSVAPFVKDISTEGYEKLKVSERHRRAQTTLVSLSVASLFLYLADTDKRALGYAAQGFGLASLGFSISWSGNLKDGIKLYNQSLEEKLRKQYQIQDGN